MADFIGNSSAETHTGDATAQNIVGNGGNDTLGGAGGNDTYIYNVTVVGGAIVAADGFDVINNNDSAGFDKIVVNSSGADIRGLVHAFRDGNNLIFNFYGAEWDGDLPPAVPGPVGGITVQNFFTDPLARIDRFEFQFSSLDVADPGGVVSFFFRTDDVNNTEDWLYEEASIDANFNDTYNKTVYDNGSMVEEFANGTMILTGSGANDSLSGGGFNDTLHGNGGNDTLWGNAGNDTLNGNDGNDQLNGGDGNDSLNGGNGDDFLIGGYGIDTLDGGSGTDYAAFFNLPTGGDPSNDGYTINFNFQGRNGFSSISVSGNGFYGGYFESDNSVINVEGLFGTSGNDVIRDLGYDRETNINGGRGNDFIVGSTYDGFNDYVWYNDLAAGYHVEIDLQYDHEYSILNNNFFFFGNAGIYDTFGVLVEVDVVQSISGVYGSNGDDKIWGTDHAAGEFYRPGLGSDYVDGRGGFDIVDYGNTSTPVNITMAAVGQQTLVNDGSGTDTLIGIESIYGSQGNDSITGNEGDNRIRGRGGNDTLDGGAGFDTIDFRFASTGVSVQLADNGAAFSVADGGGGTDLLSNFEGVRGTDSADIILGNNLVNKIDAMGGDDTVAGGAGNDTLDGNVGFDQAYYNYLQDANGYTFTLNNVAGTLTVVGKGANSAYTETDTVMNIELFAATSKNDTLVDAVAGTNNLLAGYRGNDSITGNLTDVDQAVYAELDNTYSVNANLATGVVTVTRPIAEPGYTETDTLAGIRGVWGGSGNDVLTGASTDDWFRGNAGSDLIDGGAGTRDIADYRTSGAGVTVTLEESGDTIVNDQMSGGTDTLRGIEGVAGSNFNDTLTGNSADNWFRGHSGSDVINGGGGIDTIVYNQATFSVEADLSSGFVRDGLSGIDTVSNVENVVGGDYNDSLFGSASANSLDGGKSDDFLRGNGGNDTLTGGAGFDTADYSSSFSNLTDGNGFTYVLNSTTLAITGKGANIAYTETDTVNSIEIYALGGFDDTFTDTVAGRQTQVRAGLGNDIITGNIQDSDFATYTDRNGGNYQVNADLVTGIITVTDVNNGGYLETDTVININALMGGAGADSLRGNNLSNYLRGGGGNDFIVGGGGFDLAAFTSSQQSIQVHMAEEGRSFVVSDGAGMDTLVGIEGIDGTAYDDDIIGNSSTNILRGRAGWDFLDGAGGSDVADYSGSEGAINVTLQETGETLVADGYGTVDTLIHIEGIFGTDFNDVLIGNSLDNNFRGRIGNDLMDGKAGSDGANYTSAASGLNITLAASGVDTIVNDGDGGTDTLRGIENLAGSNFNDTLNGNELDNVLRGSMGNDLLDGKAGLDVASFYSGFSAVNITLLAGGAEQVVNDGEGGSDTLRGIEGLIGTDFNDTLTGSSGNNILEGGKGQDFIVGGAGNDTMDGGDIYDRVSYSDLNTVSYAGAATGVVVNLATGMAQDGLGGTDQLENFNWVIGSGNADSITGSTTANLYEIFEGGGGNDTIDGGAIDPITGTNSNRASYQNASAAVTVNLAAGTAQGTSGDAGIGVDTLININHVRGSAFGDSLLGSDSTITEQFLGGAGNDTIDGKGGNDQVRYDDLFSSPGVIVNLATGFATDAFGNTDTLISIEGVRASSGADSLTGGAVANGTGAVDGLEFFNGLGGNDTIDGGAGFDRAEYAFATSGVNVTLGGNSNGTAQDGQGGTDVLINIEAVRGSAWDDVLTGSDIADAGEFESFEGREGNDTINGMGGIDRADYQGVANAISVDLNGSFASNDGYGYFDQLFNIENVRGSAFNDYINGSFSANLLDGAAGNDTINGGFGSDTLIGGDGDDNLNGGEANDTLQGGEGNDFLSGGFGNDSLVGGNGSGDWAQYFEASGGVNVNLVNGVVSGGSGSDTLSGIENVSGSVMNDTLAGDALNNSLRGELGNDSISGGDGNDYITGGAGNDTIDGGAGTGDTADYQFSNAVDGISVTLSSGGGMVLGGDGQDTLTNIENISGTNFNDIIVGDANNNNLQGYGGDDNLDGAGGNDFMDGGAGNDSVVGGAGNDSMNGGGGNDTLLGGTGGDTLQGGAGNDLLDGGTITDRVNYVDLNVVSYSGATGAVNVTLGGNNTITGGTATDGMGGVDTLIDINQVTGSAFNDTLTGSSDMIFEMFDGGAGNDSINGGAIDAITGQNANRANYNSAGSAVNVNLTSGTATGGAGNDTLVNINQVRGSNFADTLTGSDSTLSETFIGGAGNDTIDGKGGVDVVRYNVGAANVGIIASLATGLVTEDGHGGTDTLLNIEGLYGSNFNDVLTGGSTLNGTGVVDGFELFVGNAGNDTIDGGEGFDRADYTTAAVGVTVTLGGNSDGSALDGQGGTDVLRNIEAVRGSAFNDVLNGADTTDFSTTGEFESFEGREGNDTIDGNGGADRADYQGVAGAVTVNLSTNSASNDGYGFQDTLLDIEAVRGSAFGDSITGSSIDNRFDGAGGNDTMSGLEGNDFFIGGAGNDSIDGGSGFDTASFSGAKAGYTITRGLGNVTVSGADGTDTLTGIEKLTFGDVSVMLKVPGADYNADGKSDLLWRNVQTGANAIWQGANSAAGQDVTPVGDPTNWKILGTADFSGDGTSDILWRNLSTGVNAIWLSANSATGQDVTPLPDLTWKVAGIGDFDGDGKADILWRNSVSGGNTIWKSASSATTQDVTPIGDVNWKAGGIGDFDGDGKADIFWRNSETGANTIWLSGNSATGQDVTPLTDLSWKLAGIGDFNGDGKDDLLWRNSVSGANAIWRNADGANGQGVTPIPDQAWTVAGTGDYNADGTSDILWRNTTTGGNTIWLSANSTTSQDVTPIGDTAWTLQSQTGTWGEDKKEAAAFDFDGDGKSDLLWRNTSSGANAIWKNADAGNGIGVTGIGDTSWKAAGIGDFDGDGKADILWRNATSGANTIWKSADSATGQDVTAIGDTTWKVGGVGDFDGDGKADILWRNTTSGANTIWKSANSATGQDVTGIGDTNWKVGGIGDFDGDGKDDILWRNFATGANTIWKSGNSATGQDVTPLGDLTWKVAGVGDFDGDGKDDIMWRNSVSGANAIWKSGNSATGQDVTTIGDVNWQVAGTGDYNGDGKDDLLWRNASTGGSTVWHSASGADTVAVVGVNDPTWTNPVQTGVWVDAAGNYSA